MDVNERYAEFIDDIISQNQERELESLKETFIDNQCSMLVEQDVLQSYHIVNFNNPDCNVRVDAWGLRSAIDTSMEGSLVLIVSDFCEKETLETQPVSSFRSYIDKGKRFFLSCLKDSFRLGDLRNESDSVKALAGFIFDNREELYDITIIGLTNTRITSRSNTLVISEFTSSDYVFHYDIWDFDRYEKIQSSNSGRESVDIDFVNDYELPQGLKALTADTGSYDMKSFLFVLPGTVLFKMYEQWNERLLEQNPRTFLQFAGKVNKGLRKTLNTSPDRFFCYNNGITAVASNVDYSSTSGSIYKINNFQIVNGGQTTASIFNCARNAKKKHDIFYLEKVFVMVKLTVIEDPEKAKDIIPKISEYSNTQNKVSSSAFSIHHEFHKKMEEFSRKIWAPPREETHWYYERVLGQYKNAINLCSTKGEKKQFELQNPKNQMFKAVDMAKYYYAFDKHPDIVCKGAQKCYAYFCDKYLVASKDSEEQQVFNGTLNEDLFKENCSKALIYKALEKRQGNGVRFVSVPYIIACVTKNIESRGLSFDFPQIWKKQWDNEYLFDTLSSYDRDVLSVITDNMPESVTLLSEWAKKPECWKLVSNLKLDTSKLDGFLISQDVYNEQRKDQKTEKRETTAIEAEIYAYQKGFDYWKKLKRFISDNSITTTPKEWSILDWATRKAVSAKQAVYLIKLEHKAMEDGFSG